MPFKRQIFADGTCRTIRVDENGIEVENTKKELLDNLEKEYYERHDYVILKPGEIWDGGKLEVPKFNPMNNETKCTCGVDKVGYGIHSDWCDKATK